MNASSLGSEPDAAANGSGLSQPLLPPPSPPATFPQRLRQPSAVAELGVVRRFLASPVNGTRINSYDRRSFIEFTPLPELSSISFDVLISCQGRQVRNDSLALTGAPQFLAALRMLEQAWSGTATLDGTYDFRLSVSVLRPSVLWLSFAITDYIDVNPLHDLPCLRHLLEGGFTVEEAPAHRLFSDFYALLEPTGNA